MYNIYQAIDNYFTQNFRISRVSIVRNVPGSVTEDDFSCRWGSTIPLHRVVRSKFPRKWHRSRKTRTFAGTSLRRARYTYLYTAVAILITRDREIAKKRARADSIQKTKKNTNFQTPMKSWFHSKRNKNKESSSAIIKIILVDRRSNRLRCCL